MSRHRRLPTRFLPLLLGFFFLGSPLLAKPPVPIAVARLRPLGTVVTVVGSVTTPSGAFQSSFFDVGFAVQDLTGGLYVSLQTNLGVTPGGLVRVTGTLQDSFGLRILVPADPADVRLFAQGPPLPPLFLRTAAISERTEGLLVKVAGTITQGPIDDLPFGHKLFVDDGSGEVQVFINVQTGIDASAFSVGQRVRVTGFSSQFDDHYEIDPRSPADLVVTAP